MATSSRSSTAVSVISSSRQRGSMPVSAMTRSTCALKSDWNSCSAETFTATPVSRPSARQAASCRQARRSTSMPNGTMKPLRSATPMKRSG